MIKLICSMRDMSTKTWMPFVCVASVEQIKRDCIEFLKSDVDALPRKYPEDYEVFQCGEFDDESGELKGFAIPDRLFRLSDLAVRTS